MIVLEREKSILRIVTFEYQPNSSDTVVTLLVGKKIQM